MSSKISQLTAILKGTSYLESNDGLAAYHAAQAVLNATRMKDPTKRFATVRQALARFRVGVSLQYPVTRIYRADTNTAWLVGS